MGGTGEIRQCVKDVIVAFAFFPELCIHNSGYLSTRKRYKKTVEVNHRAGFLFLILSIHRTAGASGSPNNAQHNLGYIGVPELCIA